MIHVWPYTDNSAWRSNLEKFQETTSKVCSHIDDKTCRKKERKQFDLMQEILGHFQIFLACYSYGYIYFIYNSQYVFNFYSMWLLMQAVLEGSFKIEGMLICFFSISQTHYLQNHQVNKSKVLKTNFPTHVKILKCEQIKCKSKAYS